LKTFQVFYSVENSRELALQILSRIESGKAYADILLDTELRKSSLDARDKALVVRWRKTLDWYLDQVCKKPIRKTHPWIRYILRLGGYQLLFLDKIPPSAAINESVKLAGKYRNKLGIPAKSVKGFVNATLRQLDRDREKLQKPDTLPEPISRLATRYSYPEWMVRRWVQRFGIPGAEDACRINNRPLPLIIRVNTLKISPAELQQILAPSVQSVQVLPGKLPGLVLSGHPPISELPSYRNGHWTVQNASSILIALILDPQPGEHVLDACAGSGTKTTHIGELLKNHGKIIAVDMHEGKLRRLRENCQRLGIRIVQTYCRDITTSSKHHFQEKQGFDRILVDAPCSGLGALRKHPEAKWTKQESQILELQQLQVRFLLHAATLLRPGGVLVYSVCTTEPEENEEVIKKFLHDMKNFQIETLRTCLPDILQPYVTQEGFLRIDPPQQYFDGFFCAKLSHLS
jgi:16S rRNA (cytosine967-C5)-methyltransferase